jgi:WD40 repeat protein
MPREYPTAEASARWSTVDAATSKRDVPENLTFTREPLDMPWPVQDSTSTAAYDGPAESASSDKALVLQGNRGTPGATRRTPEGILSGVSAVTFSPDGRLVAAASLDNKVRLWYSGTGAAHRTLEGHSQAIYVVVFSPGGELLASASWDSTIRLWDLATGELCYTLDIHQDFVYAVAFQLRHEGHLRREELGEYDMGRMGTVELGDSATGKEWYKLGGHSGDSGQDIIFHAIPFSPEGQMAGRGIRERRGWAGGRSLVGSTVRRMQRTVIGRPGRDRNRVYNVAFAPDGKLVASTLGSVVMLSHPSSGRMHHKLKGHSGLVNAVTFSLDGKLVATGSVDTTVRLWSSTTGAARQTLKGHSGAVRAVAFSPDGKLVASASLDKTVKLWDSNSGVVRYSFRIYLEEAYAVAFSLDGKLMASANLDKTVRLWDPVTGAGKHFSTSS